MRHVRTQEGVKRFNLPLGAPITAEAILRAKASRGGSSGGGKGGSSGASTSKTSAPKPPAHVAQSRRVNVSDRMMDGTPAPKAPARRAAAGPAATGSTRSPYAGRRSAAPADLDARVERGEISARQAARLRGEQAPAGRSSLAQPSTLDGDHKVEVGSTEYRLSQDAKVQTPKSGDKAIAYVRDPQDGEDLHVLTENGEVPLNEQTKAAVAEKIDAEPGRFSTIKPVPAEGTDAPKTSGRRAKTREQQEADKKPDTGPELIRREMDGTPVRERRNGGGKRVASSTAEQDAAAVERGEISLRQEMKNKADRETAESNAPKISQPKIHEQDGNQWDPADVGLSRNDAGMIERIPDSTGIAPTPAPDEIEAMQSSPYTSPHLNPDGTFTEERQRLHEQIINDFLDGIEPSANPTQFMNGGGPASGKGGMTRGANAKLTNYPSSRSVDDHTGELEKGPAKALLIDPDAIKMQFPEVKEALGRLWDKDVEDTDFDKGWAGHSHEESSQLAKRLHTAALQRGIDVIYDGTGNGSVKSVKSKVAAARAAGYRVEANYLFLPPEQGIERAASRAARSKRVVPDIQIRKTYAAIPEIFDGIKDGTFDKVNLFDNRVAMSEPALHIGETGPDGKFKILDAKRYKEFMESRHQTGIDPAKVLGGDKHKPDRGQRSERYAGSNSHSVTLSDGTVVTRDSRNAYTHAVVATDKETGQQAVVSFHTDADKAFNSAFKKTKGAQGARYKFSMQEVDGPDETLQNDLQQTDSSRKANEISDSAKRSRRNGANGNS